MENGFSENETTSYAKISFWTKKPPEAHKKLVKIYGNLSSVKSTIKIINGTI